MAERVVEHDPERGCRMCPLRSGDECQVEDRCIYTPRYAGALGCAPDWCPLRAGAVVVRRPAATG